MCTHQEQVMRNHLWTCTACGQVLHLQRYSCNDFSLQVYEKTPLEQARKRHRRKPTTRERVCKLFPTATKDLISGVARLQKRLKPTGSLDAFTVGCVHILQTGISQEGRALVKPLPFPADVLKEGTTFKKSMITKGKNIVRKT